MREREKFHHYTQMQNKFKKNEQNKYNWQNKYEETRKLEPIKNK